MERTLHAALRQESQTIGWNSVAWCATVTVELRFLATVFEANIIYIIALQSMASMASYNIIALHHLLSMANVRKKKKKKKKTVDI